MINTVPLQDSFFSSDERIAAFTQGAARRLLVSGPGDDEPRIDTAFEWCLTRRVSDGERQAATEYLQQARQDLAAQENLELTPEELAWAGLFQAIFGSAEFRYLVDVD